MVVDSATLDKLLANHPKRDLQSTLFNLAHAYARASDASWNEMGTSRDLDFAAPAIMSQSFAVELLLKFFLAVDHPNATTVDELRKACVNLNVHSYSGLYNQLLPDTKAKIAASFTTLAGKQTDASGFRDALISQGDDPFVYWRYIYEQKGGYSHFDRPAFNLVTDALGKAAEAQRRATKAM